MQIKVFKAGNMKDAMAAMKAELGDDAVILHSKKYKEGGLLGIGSREVVEITAAVEEASLPKKNETIRLKHPTVTPNSLLTRYKTDGTPQAIAEAEQSVEKLTEKISEQKIQSQESEPQDFENVLEKAQEDESPPEQLIVENQQLEIPQPVEEKPQPVEEKPQPEEKPQAAEEKPQAEENPQASEEQSPQQSAVFTQEQMAQTQAMIMAQFNQMQMIQQAAIAQAQAQAAEQLRLQQQGQQSVIVQPATGSQNEAKIQRLEAEIAQMKALLAEVLGRGANQGTISLHEALKRQEVDEEILNEMAAQANAGETLVDVHTPAAKTTLINYLNEHIKFSEGVKLNRHGVRIVALLGTTGVGKTTTLAKIAAKFVLEQRTNVALITADTYRISAVEQLKTYSDILELPLEIVYNPQELASALERHRDKELILIDTAGRSQHNEYQMRELEEFLRINPRIEKHLVISATTKFTDARQIMNKFSQIEPDKIIFTKIDETASLGMIINLLRDKKYSLSYITTGQSVPDDIERAGAEVLATLLFKKVDEL